MPTAAADSKTSLQIDRSATKQLKMRFVLYVPHLTGCVLLVGLFNDWRPGPDELDDDEHGVRSVVLDLPYGRRFVFRHLGPGDQWFAEADADEVRTDGCVLYPPPSCGGH